MCACLKKIISENRTIVNAIISLVSEKHLYYLLGKLYKKPVFSTVNSVSNMKKINEMGNSNEK